MATSYMCEGVTAAAISKDLPRYGREMRGTPVKAEEIQKLENYLSKLFNSQAIELRQLPNKDDMAELHRNDEFLGTIYRDTEDGDLSYQVNFAILDIDLEE